VESGGPSVGKVGKCDVKSRHLQGCSSREQVLNVPIVCQRYELGKPSSLPTIESGFTPTSLMTVLREKLSTDPQIGQPVCCGLCRKPFFSGAVALSIAVDDFVKSCYALTA
jgi:hypothetical protein